MIQCGRYEYHGYTTKGNRSAKFWHVIHDKSNGVYIAKWGAIGKGVQGTKEYSSTQVRTKLREKVNKGYGYKDGYEESVGSNSVNYITQFLSEEAA